MGWELSLFYTEFSTGSVESGEVFHRFGKVREKLLGRGVESANKDF